MPLLPATVAVDMNEPCLLLKEEHLQSPGSKGWRRYQTLYVMRFDKPAQFVTDLGPAAGYAIDSQFRIPGGAQDATTGRFHIEHTVGELIDIAEALRAGHLGPPSRAAAPPSDLIGGYHDEMDRRARRRRGLFVSGPHAPRR